MTGVGTWIHRLFNEEKIPTYALEATAFRQTTHDTHDDTDSERPNGHPTTHKEHPMATYTNRQIALQSAVENLSEDALYVVGEVDVETIEAVIETARHFAAFLDGGEAVPSGDSPSDRPADDTETTIEAIRSLLQRSRGELGDRATTAALGQIDQLREATRGRGRGAVMGTAIEFVDSQGRSAYGSAVADRLLTLLRAL